MLSALHISVILPPLLNDMSKGPCQVWSKSSLQPEKTIVEQNNMFDKVIQPFILIIQELGKKIEQLENEKLSRVKKGQDKKK